MSESGVVTPWSAQLTLDDTVQRLQSNDRVGAISFLGSTGTEEWTEASDFDLCSLLRDYAAGHGVEATIVDGRMTEVVVIDANHALSLGRPCGDVGDETLSDFTSDAPVSDTDAVTETQWPYVHWLALSRPVYDPDGLARRARDVGQVTGRGGVDCRSNGSRPCVRS